MTVIVNGQEKDLNNPTSVAGLLQSLGLEAVRVAVELNRVILPRDRFAATDLNDGDRLEIVQFVGGG